MAGENYFSITVQVVELDDFLGLLNHHVLTSDRQVASSKAFMLDCSVSNIIIAVRFFFRNKK